MNKFETYTHRIVLLFLIYRIDTLKYYRIILTPYKIHIDWNIEQWLLKLNDNDIFVLFLLKGLLIRIEKNKKSKA